MKLNFNFFVLELVKPSLVFFFCIFSLFLNSQNDSIVVSSGFEHAFGVASSSEYVYITNIGDFFKPTDLDGNGLVSKMSFAGEMVEFNEFPEVKLNAPKGCTVIGNSLIIADVNRIVVIDINSKKLIKAIDLSNLSFNLIDVDIMDENRIFVSAKDKGKIITVDLRNGYASYLDLNILIPGVNNLVYDSAKQAIYVTGWDEKVVNSEVGKVDLKLKKYSLITNVEGKANGLVQRANELIFSNWGGGNIEPSMYRVSINYKLIKNLKVPQVSTPSEFMWDKVRKTLWIVMTGECKVVVAFLKE